MDVFSAEVVSVFVILLLGQPLLARPLAAAPSDVTHPQPPRGHDRLEAELAQCRIDEAKMAAVHAKARRRFAALPPATKPDEDLELSPRHRVGAHRSRFDCDMPRGSNWQSELAEAPADW